MLYESIRRWLEAVLNANLWSNIVLIKRKHISPVFTLFCSTPVCVCVCKCVHTFILKELLSDLYPSGRSSGHTVVFCRPQQGTEHIVTGAHDGKVPE